MEMQYSSNGKGNLGVTLGAIGTGLGILGGGLNGILGNMGNGAYTPMNFGYNQELARKDMEISTLRSENFTNSKVIELERQLCEFKTAQSVVNSQLSNAIAVNTNNLTQVMDLTKLVVPTSSLYSVATSL